MAYSTDLQTKLDNITTRTRALVQPDRLAITDAAVQELFATGIEDRILPIGATAPTFDLPDAAATTLTNAAAANARLIHYGGQSEKIKPDKMIRLFRAKALIFEKYWPLFFVNFGMNMLEMWAGTRTIGLWVRQLISPGRRDAFLSWQEVWRRRQEFRPSHPSPAGGPVAFAGTPK